MTSAAIPTPAGGRTRRTMRQKLRARARLATALVCARSRSRVSAERAASLDPTDGMLDMRLRPARLGQSRRYGPTVLVVDRRGAEHLVPHARPLDGDLAGGATRPPGHHGDPRRQVHGLVHAVG